VFPVSFGAQLWIISAFSFVVPLCMLIGSNLFGRLVGFFWSQNLKPNGCEAVKQMKRNTVPVFVGIGMMEM
jgi:hypothetical protein